MSPGESQKSVAGTVVAQVPCDTPRGQPPHSDSPESASPKANIRNFFSPVPRLLDKYYELMNGGSGTSQESSRTTGSLTWNGVAPETSGSPNAQITAPSSASATKMHNAHPPGAKAAKTVEHRNTGDFSGHHNDQDLTSRLNYLVWAASYVSADDREGSTDSLDDADPIRMCHPEAMLWSSQPDPAPPYLLDDFSDSSPAQTTSDDEELDEEDLEFASSSMFDEDMDDILEPYTGRKRSIDEMSISSERNQPSIIFIDTARGKRFKGKHTYDKTRVPSKSSLKLPRDPVKKQESGKTTEETANITFSSPSSTSTSSSTSGKRRSMSPERREAEVTPALVMLRRPAKRVIWDLDGESDDDDPDAPRAKRVRLTLRDDEELDDDDDDKVHDIIMDYASPPDMELPSPEPEDHLGSEYSDSSGEWDECDLPTPSQPPRRRFFVTNP